MELIASCVQPSIGTSPKARGGEFLDMKPRTRTWKLTKNAKGAVGWERMVSSFGMHEHDCSGVPYAKKCSEVDLRRSHASRNESYVEKLVHNDRGVYL